MQPMDAINKMFSVGENIAYIGAIVSGIVILYGLICRKLETSKIQTTFMAGAGVSFLGIFIMLGALIRAFMLVYK